MAPLLNILILAPMYFSRLSSAAVPTPVPFVGSWSYLGCANEIPGRALSGASIAGDTMTVETCLDYCTESQFGLAGLEYGGECFCGNELAFNSTIGATGCDMPCRGNETQTCGGPNRLSVYEDAHYTPPEILPRVGPYVSIGCITEVPGRALSEYSFTSEGMTAPLCVQTCDTEGYSYAGVEYATECYCGNQLSNQTVSAPASACNMKCPGNLQTFCGGSNHLVVYHKSS